MNQRVHEFDWMPDVSDDNNTWLIWNWITGKVEHRGLTEEAAAKLCHELNNISCGALQVSYYDPRRTCLDVDVHAHVYQDIRAIELADFHKAMTR